MLYYSHPMKLNAASHKLFYSVQQFVNHSQRHWTNSIDKKKFNQFVNDAQRNLKLHKQ